MDTKICKGCGKEQDLEDGFSKMKSTKDGYDRYCKICKAKRSKDYRDAKLANSNKTAKRKIKAFKKMVAIAKPPLGLRPRKIVMEERMEEIQGAVERYMNGKRSVPIEWLSEYNDLADALLSGGIILNAGS